jgi:Holliday junction resolvasome RuvABC ATP-dependent DNA helicase subunit
VRKNKRARITKKHKTTKRSKMVTPHAENPFALTPKKAELGRIFAPVHEESLKRILRAVEGGGLAACVGRTGIGKTTLLERAAREMVRVGITPILVPCGGLVKREEDVLRAILSGLYLQPRGNGIELYYQLRDLAGRERMAVLLDDFTSSPVSLKSLGETVRMLADLPNFSIVLSGTPDLLRKLTPSLRSRLLVTERLGAPKLEEVSEMLKRRGALASLELSPTSIRILYRKGKGVPREVLKLAARAFERSKELGIPLDRAVRKTSGR